VALGVWTDILLVEGMTMDYTWKVTGIKVKDEINAEGVTLPNAVCQTYWEKHGVDANGNEGMFAGATPFSAADVSQGEFVSFESLDEATVLGWIQAVVVGHYETHVNAQIQKQIDNQAISEPGLPWASTEESEP
jgi:hypothetical protein